MKKILFLSFLSFFGTQGFSQAVCNPNPFVLLLGLPGVYPNNTTGGMTSGTINQPYTETFTIVVPADTTIDLSQFGIPLGTVTLAIDALEVTSVDNLPSGLSYQCDNAGCSWVGSDNGCFKVSGTPTQSGTFTVDVQTAITITVPNLGPFTTPSVPIPSDLTIDGPNSVSPASSEISISPNQPDPFATTTVIPFTTTRAARCTFSVTDMSGRTLQATEIQTNAGENHFTFDGSSLPAGLYHYRLEQNGAFAAGKMTIVK